MSDDKISILDDAGKNRVNTAWAAAQEQFALLEKALESGIISEDSYTYRKKQIINKLTGTEYPLERSTVSSAANYTFCSDITSTSGQDTELQIKKYPPPDWSKIKKEAGIKIIWNTTTKDWSREHTWVKLDDRRSFSSGSFRAAFHLQDLSDPEVRYVAKLSTQDRKDREVYFYDVKAQAIASQLAEKFNGHNPPKPCEFISAWVLMLLERDGAPLCGVEPFISGIYFKYSDNTMWKNALHRNTPAAFSHYTYEVSDKELLVCDIQGVEDCYTDPQVHSNLRGVRFGKGDRGRQGINDFFSDHICNDVCKYLNLPNEIGLPYQKGHTRPEPHDVNPIPRPRKFSGHKNGADPPLNWDGGIMDIDWISNVRSNKIFHHPHESLCPEIL